MSYSSIVSTIFNMSITSSIVALIVIIIRGIFSKKMPKVFSYILWSFVFIRLALPFEIPSVFSISNITNPAINSALGTKGLASIQNNIPMLQNQHFDAQNIVIASLPNFENMHSMLDIYSRPRIELLIVGIWLFVLLGLFLYFAISYFRIGRRLRTAIIFDDKELVESCKIKLNYIRNIRVFTSENFDSPFVFGLIKPKIILPKFIVSTCSKSEIEYIILHELIHIKRFDNITKPIFLILLFINWFNPIIWLSFFMSNKDREIACDERVLIVSNADIQTEYAHLLINIGTYKGSCIGNLAFGENSIKSRIRSIADFKRKTFLAWMAAFIILAVVGLGCITSPQIKADDSVNTEIKNAIADSQITYASVGSYQSPTGRISDLSEEEKQIIKSEFSKRIRDVYAARANRIKQSEDTQNNILNSDPKLISNVIENGVFSVELNTKPIFEGDYVSIDATTVIWEKYITQREDSKFVVAFPVNKDRIYFKLEKVDGEYKVLDENLYFKLDGGDVSIEKTFDTYAEALDYANQVTPNNIYS